MKEQIIFTVKMTDKPQKEQVKKYLSDIKSKNRYNYPEIILMALKSFKAGLQ
jgi:uncharacterized protein involved in tolerance to divalent cations